MKISLSAYKTSIAVAMIFSLQSFKTFSQTTRFNLLLNEVNSNFNYGNLNGDLKSYKKTIAGVQVGATFQAGITQKFSVVTEAYFMMKGASLKTGNPITGEKSTLRLYTAEIPVLGRLQLGRVYINSGPYVAYAFAGHLKTEGSETELEKSASLAFNDIPGSFRRWEMGLQAGAGYVFHIKKLPLALDVRYGYGLTNLSQDIERYNRTLTISVLVFKPWKTNPFAKKTTE